RSLFEDSVVFKISFFFFSSRRRHTRSKRDWSSDVCSSDLILSGGEVSVTEYQNSIIIAVIAALLAAALCGAFNGFLVAKLKIQRSEERRVGKECRSRWGSGE